jgi:hypothetical protein
LIGETAMRSGTFRADTFGERAVMTIPLSTAGEVFLGHLKDVICPTLHAGQEDVPIFGKTILGNIQPGQLGNRQEKNSTLHPVRL